MPDWAVNVWYHVQGWSNCHTAMDFTLTDEDKKYHECGACNRMTMWSWQVPDVRGMRRDA